MASALILDRYAFALTSCLLQAGYLVLVEYNGEARSVGSSELMVYNAIWSIPALLMVLLLTHVLNMSLSFGLLLISCCMWIELASVAHGLPCLCTHWQQNTDLSLASFVRATIHALDLESFAPHENFIGNDLRSWYFKYVAPAPLINCIQMQHVRGCFCIHQ